MRAADVYMLGHAKIGTVIQRAGAFAGANVPFMVQNVGGDITRAMSTHMQAAFPTANFHFHCDAETWKTDVVKERLEPVNGFVRVPEVPGLGVTLDRAALERATAKRLPGLALPFDARLFYLYYDDRRFSAEREEPVLPIKVDNRPLPERAGEADTIAIHTGGLHVATVAEADLRVFDTDPRQDRHAVPLALPVVKGLVAERGETERGKRVVAQLRLL